MKRSEASGRGPNITNTVAVYSLIDPLSFTLKRSDKIIRREMRMTSRSLRRNSVRRESKTLKSCRRLVLLDYDLRRDIFKTASKVKCEAWTREWEKRKPSRVQDVSKIHGMYSLASTSALETEFLNSSSLFCYFEVALPGMSLSFEPWWLPLLQHLYYNKGGTLKIRLWNVH